MGKVQAGLSEDFSADAVANEIASEMKKVGIHKVKVSGNEKRATVEYTFRDSITDFIYCKLNTMENIKLEIDSWGDGKSSNVDVALAKLDGKEFESYKGNEIGWVKEVAKVVTPILHEALAASKKVGASSVVAKELLKIAKELTAFGYELNEDPKVSLELGKIKHSREEINENLKKLSRLIPSFGNKELEALLKETDKAFFMFSLLCGKLSQFHVAEEE